MVDPNLVFDSVRRGYNALEHASNDEITSYFEGLEPDVMMGHINNIKGILFEQVYVDQLAEQGIHAEVFEFTNHPGADVSIFENGEAINELEMVATDSVSYINSTFAESPDITIVATSEVASVFESEMVIDSGIENIALENAVTEALVEDIVNPLSPVSVLGWLIGLPF